MEFFGLLQFLFYSFLRGDNPDPATRERVMRHVKSENSTILNAQFGMRETKDSMYEDVKGILNDIITSRINTPLTGAAASRSNDPDDPLGVAKGVKWERPEMNEPNSKFHVLFHVYFVPRVCISGGC